VKFKKREHFRKLKNSFF